jgi:hypothetical protein
MGGKAENEITGAGEGPWLTPVILATWKTEMRRIEVLGQPGQQSSRDPISMEKSWMWYMHLSFQQWQEA